MALSLQYLRKIDPQLEGLSEDDAESVCADYYKLAELAFEFWMLRKFGSKDPLGLLTELQAGHTISK